MKKIAVLLLPVLIITGVISYLVTRGSSKPLVPLPVTTIDQVQAPRNIEPPSSDVVFSYNGPLFSPPDNLPTYAVTYPSDLPTQAASLVRQWGFVKSQTKPVSYVYDWIDDNKYLSYNDQSKSVSMMLMPPQEGAAPSLSVTPQDVFSTLSSFHFISKDFSFTETGVQEVKEEGEGADSQSSITVTSYQSVIKNTHFPFFFSGLTRSVGEVRTTKDGRVVSFSLFVTPELQKEQERQVIGLEQMLHELNSKKGYLAGLSGDTQEYPFEETASFSHVTISTISLAYLYIAKESRFVPVFVIEGQGQSIGQKTQHVRYYLRATS